MWLWRMIPLEYRLCFWGLCICTQTIAVILATWQVQDWRYAELGERQATNALARSMSLESAASSALRLELDKRLRAEQNLDDLVTTHQREVDFIHSAYARLRSRLATADVRMSAILKAWSVVYPRRRDKPSLALEELIALKRQAALVTD